MSASSPWQHCPGDPAATEAAAGCALAPDDTVYFKGGVVYVFTGGTGILLNWDGAPDHPIIYDGNSAGDWGIGRAKFTDLHGANAMTAFLAANARHDLVFKSLEIGGMGGAQSLPPDFGAPSDVRYGGGIAFDQGVTGVSIDDCVFRELGYWFNAKPMSAASIAGAGVSIAGACRKLSITNSSFARVKEGCDLSRATDLTEVRIAHCAFGDSVVWPVDLPAGSSSKALLHDCTAADGGEFTTGRWAGYGPGPRVEVMSLAAGAFFSLSVTAAASPAPAFQWHKNGVPIPGATRATLNFAAATAADSGLYTVVATNAAGSGVSNTMAIAVTSPTGAAEPPPEAPVGQAPASTAPVIQVQPVDQWAAPFGTVVFTTAAAGTPAPTYQWTRNGIAFDGWTNATLVLSGLTANDIGTYLVVATNASGSVVSQPATLTLIDGVVPAPAAPAGEAPVVEAPGFTSPPAVYTLSNAVAGNHVIAFSRNAAGALVPAGAFPTGGSGSGAGLGSQGALTMTDDGRWLLAVNADSGSLSVFSVQSNALMLTDVVSSKGLRPVSVTVADNLVYVLNAGGAAGGDDNISGFYLTAQGKLLDLPGSTQALSAANTAPAQVSFGLRGDLLIVTEKATNRINRFIVSDDGRAGVVMSTATYGLAPFGFAISSKDFLLVSETAPRALSSYAINSGAMVDVATASLTNMEAVASRVVLSKNEHYAYTANAASNSISGYRVGQDGSLDLLDADGVVAVANRPLDLAVSSDDQFLFALNAGSQAITTYRIGLDGRLTAVATVDGVPAGAAGLVAR